MFCIMSSDVGNLEAYLRNGSGHIHLVGICGVGMAGLALLLKKAGFKVSGCDEAYSDLASRLAEEDISVEVGHDIKHIGQDVDVVVRTSAVPKNAPEIIAASDKGIPVYRRGELLAALSSAWKTLLAVSGTHGKTTTASFLLQMFQAAGKDPSWCIGGDTPGVGQLSVAGTGDGEIIITESDESDGTVALYRPVVGVITNIEYDHMENFDNPEAFEKCFMDFAEKVSGSIVYCSDDPGSGWLADDEKAVSFGRGDSAEFRVNILKEGGVSSSFEVIHNGHILCGITLPVPGEHNILNATAAFVAALQLGLETDVAAAALEQVCLPGRRFQKVAENKGITVVSDYAHHPSEIRALVRTAVSQGSQRILAVFQPHRYSRTNALCEDFPPAFEGVDELVLCPVYAASENPIEGGTIYDLYKCFREMDVDDVPVPVLAGNLDQAWEYLKRSLKSGDLLLVVGAGDVVNIANNATEEIGMLPLAEAQGGDLPELPGSDVFFDVPMSGKTTLGIGGSADIWIEVGSERDLASLMAWSCSTGSLLSCVGCGSNVLVSDIGIRGAAFRLKGEDFSGIEHAGEESGMVVLRVGAGVSIAELLTWTMEKGLLGLEFLEGIPATLGGVLKMNAGAWGDEIKNHILSIRCLNSDGRVCILPREELEWEYRRCVSLDERFALEAQILLEETDGETVVAARQAAREKRAWMRGIKSAGSIFRNPAGEFAGRLIDEAGLKGLSVGGARVFEKHANVIVTEQGATASDVKALLEIVRSRVALASGMDLECEIVEMI
ncbi:hypothetical protein BVX94_02670 [bacterium B17]|nr:hypothetical protein BVX94_02670 [bacterium B17]